MRRGQREIAVGGQQCKVVANAQLRQDSIDRADLNTGPTTAISKVRRVDMILPIGW